MAEIYVFIPLFPLLAAVIMAVAGRWLGEASRRVGIFAMGVACSLSIAAFLSFVLAHDPQPISIPLYEFFRSGDFVVDFGLYIDQLTVLLLLLVTGVSFLVHVFASEYMIGDARYARFFGVTALFTFAMVTLVMSRNLLMMFMCWEVMGICSYLLISHQAHRKAAASAATKAFLVNAVADVGLLFAVILTFATFRTLDIREIIENAPSMSGQTMNFLGGTGLEMNVAVTTLITLFLFMGCLGKSAQIPFHAWLPNAMEAPTPVSALIHAATMVNAGPFLLVRFSALLVLSPVAMAVIAVVGATTALFAAVVSMTQSDVKKILAYSTISQIGFMIMACGVGAFVAAIFHMLAHGFLKGYLFLSTGSQLGSTGTHSQEEHLVEQRRTPWLLYVAALILSCAPVFLIFSGPYENVWTTLGPGAGRGTFWAIGLLTVFFTAIYLFRGITSLFARSTAAQSTATQSTAARVQPRLFSALHLASISAGALVLIGILVGVWSWFAPFLTPALGTPSAATVPGWQAGKVLRMLAPGLLAALSGWAVAITLARKQNTLHLARSRWAKTLYVLFLNKFYFDEIYAYCVVRPTLRCAKWLWRVVDAGGIDRAIRGTATTLIGIARWLWQTVDLGGVDRAVVQAGKKSVAVARWLWQRIDVRMIDRGVEKTGSESVSLARILWEKVDVRRIGKSSEDIGRAASATGLKLQDVEPRTLQHHLLVLILSLVLAIAFFYWLAL